jgi:hypothetical protein
MGEGKTFSYVDPMSSWLWVYMAGFEEDFYVTLRKLKSSLMNLSFC